MKYIWSAMIFLMFVYYGMIFVKATGKDTKILELIYDYMPFVK